LAAAIGDESGVHGRKVRAEIEDETAKVNARLDEFRDDITELFVRLSELETADAIEQQALAWRPKVKAIMGKARAA
jgi:hypothetical protein